MAVIAESTVDYGVTIPVSTLVTDWKVGAMAGALNFAQNSVIGQAVDWVGDKLRGGYSQLSDKLSNIGINMPALLDTSNAGLLGSAANILSSSNGQVKSSGAIGSFMAYNGVLPTVYCFFYGQAESNLANWGAPLNEKRQLKNLSGFCLCQNAKVSYSSKYPTDPEQIAVETALNGGIFLE